MSYIAFNQIGELFVNVFGSPILATALILGFFLFSMIVIRMSWISMIVVLLPVILTLVAVGTTSELWFLPKDVIYIAIVIIAIILSGFYFYFQR